MAFESLANTANAQNQAFLKNMLWSQTWKPSPLFKRLFAGVDKSILTGDDMKSKVISGNSFYIENGGAGAAIGATGTLTFAEYTFVKKLQAIPLNMDLRMQIELDNMNNKDSAAATTARWFKEIVTKADDLVEWQMLGDNSGKIAGVKAATAIAAGVVTLDADTPRKVFDKLLSVGTYVLAGALSSGVATSTAATTTGYIHGWISANDPVAKTITLTTAQYGTTTTNLDKAATASLYIFFATPGTAQTAAVTGMAGVGLASTTTDLITMTCMNGIRKTNEVLTGSYALHGITKSAQFNPIYLAGDSTKGLLPGNLSELMNNINTTVQSQHVIGTSNIIWNDWCDAFRAASFVDAFKEQANFEPGFMSGGRIIPVHAEGYWDALGVVHGIDTSTHHIIYSQMPFLRDAGTDEVGWAFRFPEALHQNSAYYGAGNQLVFMGNLVSDGRRNQNFMMDSLQTTALYGA